MANSLCVQTFATLRLFGQHLHPEKISAVLKVGPSYAASKGQVFSANGRSDRRATTGRWDLETDQMLHSDETEDHLRLILDVLDKAQARAIELPGVEAAEIFCFWLSRAGHGGPSFSAAVLGRLAFHGIMLTVDGYSSGSAEET